MEHNEFLSTFSVFKNRTELDLGFCVFLNEDLGLKSDIFYSLKSVKLNRTQLFHFVLFFFFGQSSILFYTPNATIVLLSAH